MVASTDRLSGIYTSLAVKAPCRVATTANISLLRNESSTPPATVDGVTITEGMRVLVKDQTDQTENGIYVASLVSSWARAADFDGNRDVTQGTLLVVYEPTVGNVWYQVTTAAPVVIGTSNITFQQIAAPVAGRADIGTLLKPRTYAEEQAGIMEYTVLNVSGHIVRPWLEPGNCMRYGADPSYTADSRAAIQAAINAASYAHDGDDGHPCIAYVPTGHYKVSGDLYCEYNAANNPNFNGGSPSTYHGRMRFHGDCPPAPADIHNDRARGTWIQFDAGYRLIVNSGQSGSGGVNQSRAFEMDRLGISGNYAGGIVELKYLPTLTLIERVAVQNKSTNAAACGFDIENVWEMAFAEVFSSGPDFNGKSLASGEGTRTSATGCGFKIRSTNMTYGGNVRWTNVNANGWDIGWDFGITAADFIANEPGGNGIRNHHFLQCQAQYVRCGWDMKAGVSSAKWEQCWGEWIDEYASIGSMWHFHESAGKGKLGANTNEVGVFVIDTGSVSAVNNSATDIALVRVGSSDADPFASASGTVIVDNLMWNQAAGPVMAIRRYNSKQNGALIVRNPQYSGQAAKFLVIDDEDQHGEITIEGLDGLRWLTNPDAYWVVDSSGNDMRHRLNGRGSISCRLPDGTATHDFSESCRMPAHTDSLVAAGQTHTIKLPSYAFADGEPVFISKLLTGNGSVTLDPTAPAWAATTYYVQNQIVSKGGELYVNIEPGTSGATGPTGTSDGQTDGTCVWNHLVTGDNTINGTSSFAVTSNFGMLMLKAEPVGVNPSPTRGLRWIAKEL